MIKNSIYKRPEPKKIEYAERAHARAEKPEYFYLTGDEIRFPVESNCKYEVASKRFYGMNHQYRLYPSTFKSQGVTYLGGYYDEAGNYYKDIIFLDSTGRKRGYLTCPACDYTGEYGLSKSWEKTVCRECRRAIPTYDIPADTAYNITNDAYYAVDNATVKHEQIRSAYVSLMFCFTLFILAIQLSGCLTIPWSQAVSGGNYPLGKTVYLSRTGASTYKISDHTNYSKNLVWHRQQECYYDGQTGTWLQYDTDTETWRYWFNAGEPGDEGEGWCEHRGKYWYTETEHGEMEKVYKDIDLYWYIV